MRVTVPVVLVPPVTLLGEIITECTAIDAAIVNPVVIEWVPKVAIIVTGSLDDTVEVVIEKVIDVLPAGIVTDVGENCKSGLLEVKKIVVPPVGATSLIVTVPVLLAPPTTAFGDEEIECNETEPAIVNPVETV